MTEPNTPPAEDNMGKDTPAASLNEAELTPTEQALETETIVSDRRKLSFFPKTALLIAIIALLAVIWQANNARRSFNQQEKDLTKRLEQFNANNQQSLALAKNADDRSTEAAAHASILDQKLAESVDQQEALQTLYVELANNREERVIAEVEQLLIIANQQLQLAGNIKPALLALQTADSRLQQLDSVPVIQLRKTISQDIQRLQSLPLIDVVGMSLRLERLSEAVDELPLVSERHPGKAPTLATPEQTNAWHRLVQEIWHDLKSMIRIERIDRREPPLLSPDQDFFLRENIKLRILTARIALLQHDEATYRADLEATDKWLKAHFDTREVATQNALLTIKQLLANDIVLDMPEITESLGLVSKYKLTLERAGTNNREPKTKPAGAR